MNTLLFCIIYALVFALLIFTSYRVANRTAFALVKTLLSLFFFTFACIGIARATSVLNPTLLIAAFALCVAGDVFLGFDRDQNPGNLFLCGMLSFLVAHVCFSLALLKIAPLRYTDIVIPVVTAVACYFLTGLKDMEAGKMRIPTIVYSLFVSLFFARSCTLVLFSAPETRFSPQNMLFLIGSALFFISDVIILFLLFYRKRFVLTKFFNLLTYYTGMLLLAFAMR